MQILINLKIDDRNSAVLVISRLYGKIFLENTVIFGQKVIYYYYLRSGALRQQNDALYYYKPYYRSYRVSRSLT